ncbi:CPBP family intramembrane metalloprotease [Neobacillus pocheonensis]|uniref:CPBP family intramembrane metalloprotease n=1 Tax=Neobacillus pocheonensis TaxID=363869 RepID=A0ABT0WKH4_9BACI|nr:CPBP family intramembrane metalloprotease [Neobacillus pocheonensis]
MTFMTTNLTQSISGKLLFAILIITIGAEVDLYITRYSTLASSLYDAIMVSSFFIGWKLNKRLVNPTDTPKTKRQRSLQFTGAFLIFFIGSTIINFYSGLVFHDFNNNYDQNVQQYTDSQPSGDDVAPSDSVSTFFDQVDAVGPDIYTDALAGLEEVWRLGYMILILVICKKIFHRRWEKGSRDIFLLIALFITSILFGIDHTLDTAQPWSVKIGAIVTFANMGLLFGLILYWTRNLWVAVIAHSVYDITATISWYYFDTAVEAFAGVVFIVHLILLSLEKRQQNKRIKQQIVDPIQMAE